MKILKESFGEDAFEEYAERFLSNKARCKENWMDPQSAGKRSMNKGECDIMWVCQEDCDENDFDKLLNCFGKFYKNDVAGKTYRVVMQSRSYPGFGNYMKRDVIYNEEGKWKITEVIGNYKVSDNGGEYIYIFDTANDNYETGIDLEIVDLSEMDYNILTSDNKSIKQKLPILKRLAKETSYELDEYSPNIKNINLNKVPEDVLTEWSNRIKDYLLEYMDDLFESKTKIKDNNMKVLKEETQELENTEDISVKEVLNKIVQKFGNKKCKYKLVAQEFERYSSGGVYSVTFHAPNDYIALFSMMLHCAPTVANFEEEMYGDELQEYLDEHPTYEALLELASRCWWGDGDDYIISLDNLTTGENLYSGGDEGFDEYEDDDYDWDEDEDLEESVNPLKDAQDEAKKHQKGKGPFVKLDAGDVEHNINAFNNSTGSSCEGGACMESLQQSDKEEIEEIAKADFESGHIFAEDYEEFKSQLRGSGIKVTEELYNYYLKLKDLGPVGFYQEFKNKYEFDDFFVAEYGDEDLEESINEIEAEEKKIEPQTINIRQALNELDKTIANSNLLNMYEACRLSVEEKQKLALMLAGQADANEIYEFLANSCEDSYLHSESHIVDTVECDWCGKHVSPEHIVRKDEFGTICINCDNETSGR